MTSPIAPSTKPNIFAVKLLPIAIIIIFDGYILSKFIKIELIVNWIVKKILIFNRSLLPTTPSIIFLIISGLILWINFIKAAFLTITKIKLVKRIPWIFHFYNTWRNPTNNKTSNTITKLYNFIDLLSRYV